MADTHAQRAKGRSLHPHDAQVGQVGSLGYLKKHCGLDAAHIASAVREGLKA